MAKVLFLNAKTVGKDMAGPGIRVWELAKVIGKENKVSIILPSKNVFLEIIRNEIIVFPIYSLDLAWLLLARLLRKKIVIDAYFVPLFENIEKYNGQPRLKKWVVNISKLRTKCLLLTGDLVLCASERQCSYWLEQFSAYGRKAARMEIAPTGIRSERPIKKHDLIKGIVPGISRDDKVVLWASGLWPWLDPMTAIKAIRLVEDEKVKLIFFGIKMVDEHFKGEGNGPIEKAVELAKASGLLNKRIFFVDRRVPYEEIADYLLEADVALNLHYDNLETRYAYRTRLLDYIWAGIPIVATKGDVLAEEISRRGMGIVVDYKDEKAVAQGIEKLISDAVLKDKFRGSMSIFAAEQVWEKNAEPFNRYCKDPFASDVDRGIFNISVLFIDIIRFYFRSAIFLLLRIIGRKLI